MLSQSSLKQYTSCGIQTDPFMLQSSLLCETHILSYSLDSPMISDPDVFHSGSSSGFLCGQLSAEGKAGAYMRPQTRENSDQLLDLSRVRPNPGHTSIADNIPKCTLLGSKRVVSLPNDTPRHPTEAVMQSKTRTVSMPASGKHTSFGPLKAIQTKSSFPADTSLANSSAPKQSRGREYPLNLPRTPSPPSSPDSVVIIGNEDHIFLGQVCADDDGWITWANSPPRPIPALHGPLSLPYARCPSGAEGTVVEGDNLAHKIWGLGSDDAQVCSRSSRLPTAQIFQSGGLNVPQTTGSHFEDHRNITLSSLQRQKDTVIDLSKPSTFYHVLDNRNPKPGFQSYVTSCALAGKARSFRLPAETLDVNSTHSLHENVWRPDFAPSSKSSINNSLPQCFDPAYNAKATSGPINSRGETTNSGGAQNRLNKSAPVFVPVGIGIGLTRMTHIEQTREKRSREHDSRQNILSLPLARMQQGYQLPTPPSSSSPQWSPIFPRSIAVGFPREIVEPSQGDLQSGGPAVSTPRPDPDDFSQKLTGMIELGNLSKSRDCVALDVLNHRYRKDEDIESTENAHNHSRKWRNFPYDQPRSIPLARLIQRRLRLSSVTEEDAPVGRDSSSTQLRKSDVLQDSQQVSPKLLNVQPFLKTKILEEGNFDTYAESDTTLAHVTTSEGIQSDYANCNAIVKLPPRFNTATLVRKRIQQQ